MNYKQRLAYAENRANDRLKVLSPKSLLGLSTEKMYLPRNDKFEGYSQFPRPKLPPEDPPGTAVERRPFDSFITKRPKGQLSKVSQDLASERGNIPLKELLERK